MKNPSSKEELISLITRRVFKGNDSSLENHVYSFMTQEGRFDNSDYIELKVNPETLASLPVEELCWFAISMESYSDSICKVADYFEPFEIDLTRSYSRDMTKKSELLRFKFIQKQAPYQYACIASVKQIGLLKRFGLVKAIPDVQRQSREIQVGNEILRKIHVNYKRVNDIAYAISEDQFYYNEIRFNLDNDDVHEPIIDEDAGTLTIPQGGFIIIPDGNHRTLACSKAIVDYSEKMSLFEDRYFIILLTHYPTTKAREIVAQELNRERVPMSHVKSLKTTNANSIVELIKFNVDSDKRYANKMVTTRNEIHLNNGIILKPLLADAIEHYYKTEQKEFESPVKRKQLANWLVEFYNEISDIYSADLSNYKSIKKVRWNFSPEAWVGYTYMSAILFDKEGWEKILRENISKIDFDMSKYPGNRGSNSVIIRDVEKYFGGVIHGDQSR